MMTFTGRRHLSYLYLRETWRRVVRHFTVGRLSAIRFSGTVPDRLLVAPTDLRAIDPFVAEEILEGRFPLAGRELVTDGESPFSFDMPSDSFAMRLHTFGWMRHIRANKTDAACSRARQLADQWIAAHGRRISGIAWDPDITAQRVIAWLSHSTVVFQGAEAPFYRRFMKSLSVQIRYLRRVAPIAPDGEVRLRVRIALAMASIAMPAPLKVVRRAGRKLDHEIDRQILPDGGHVSRNPRATLDLLLDLLPLRQTYVNLGHDVPAKLIPGIDRMYPALRFFRHQDGDLALFNGATATLANELMSVLRYDETAGQPFKALPHSHYHRLAAGGTVMIVDTGHPLSTDLSKTAHAGSLSFEMSSGRHRFIVNAGSPKFAAAAYRQMARATAAHSTVVLNELSSARVSRSAYLGVVMVSGASQVNVSRVEEEDGSVSLTANHDGYREPLGVVHERRFILSADGNHIAGRDRFLDGSGEVAHPKVTVTAVARFHVHPAIDLIQVDVSSVLMKASDGETWLFSAPEAELNITEDIFFSDASGVRASEQLEIAFDLGKSAEILWEIRRHK